MRYKRDAVEMFFDHGLHIPSRTIDLVHESAEIDRSTVSRFLRQFHTLTHISKDPIHIFINSPGGQDEHCYAIYDLIDSSDTHITIEVIGEACSSGSIILQAADHRVMHKHAYLMLHNGEHSPTGNAVDVERAVINEKRLRTYMYEIYAKRSGKPVAYFRRKCTQDWFLSAAEALAENLIDEIIE
jgi:ATP-dependent Clp protease protease subunit